MPKFTQGPWKAQRLLQPKERLIAGQVTDNAGVIVAQWGIIRPEVAAEAGANARLIAAAPDLYEMLGYLVDSLEAIEAGEQDWKDYQDNMGDARALLMRIDQPDNQP